MNKQDKETATRLTADAGVVGDADAAVVVEGDGSDFSGAASAVLVVSVVTRHRVTVVVVDIRAGQAVLKHQTLYCALCLFKEFM